MGTTSDLRKRLRSEPIEGDAIRPTLATSPDCGAGRKGDRVATGDRAERVVASGAADADRLEGGSASGVGFAFGGQQQAVLGLPANAAPEGLVVGE